MKVKGSSDRDHPKSEAISSKRNGLYTFGVYILIDFCTLLDFCILLRFCILLGFYAIFGS
jgi:hypothetical protein